MPIDPDVYPLARRLDDLRAALAPRLSATEAHMIAVCVRLAVDLQDTADSPKQRCTCAALHNRSCKAWSAP